MEKRSKKISARELVEDIREGLTDEELTEKHNISEVSLYKLLEKLKQSKLLTQEQLDARRAVLDSLEGMVEPALVSSPAVEPPDSKEPPKISWICPSCKSPRSKAYEVCPDCGIIVAKWLGRQRQDPPPTEEEIDRPRTLPQKPPAPPKEKPEIPPEVKPEPVLPKKERIDPREMAEIAAPTVEAVDEAGRRIKMTADALSQMDLAQEIVPIDQSNIEALKKDFIFWGVAALGVLPVFFGTFRDPDHELTAFALLFAAIWGVIFKRLILADAGEWKAPVVALFFTGLIGIPLMLALYKIFPTAYLKMSQSENAMISLVGYVFQVGLWEELTKIVPVIIYLCWLKKSRRPIEPQSVILVGVFSGLGFAAFENMHYAEGSVVGALLATQKHGAAGLVMSVKGAMIIVITRALACVFAHGVYCGIFSYFVAMAAKESDRGRRGLLFIIGWCVSTVIHGAYDWFLAINVVMAASINAFGFVLLYAYIAKLKILTSVESPVTSPRNTTQVMKPRPKGPTHAASTS